LGFYFQDNIKASRKLTLNSADAGTPDYNLQGGNCAGEKPTYLALKAITALGPANCPATT